MEPMPARLWIDACAERLRQQWPSIGLAQLEDVALVLWRDARARRQPPHDAAEAWLRQGVLAE